MAAPKTQGSVRSTIRKNAAELFARHGVAAVSLFDIAQASIISKGTLYYHYPTKESLVADVAEEHFMQFSAALLSWIEQITPDMTLEQGVLRFAGSMLEEMMLLRLRWALMAEAMLRGGELQERFAAKAREWAVLIEVGALKLPQADVLRRRSAQALPLLDAWGMHITIGEPLTADMLTELILG
ncbi:MAG: helix-turn-helix domain containing protein [Eubacteriales bacterium]|nr:helix-turn-helix domain containing protein [Eubacteriales bacterium]